MRFLVIVKWIISTQAETAVKLSSQVRRSSQSELARTDGSLEISLKWNQCREGAELLTLMH